MAKFYYSYEHDLRNRNAPLVTEHVIRRRLDSLVTAARLSRRHASIDNWRQYCLLSLYFIRGLSRPWPPMHALIDARPRDAHPRTIHGLADSPLPLILLPGPEVRGSASSVTAPASIYCLKCDSSRINLLFEV